MLSKDSAKKTAAEIPALEQIVGILTAKAPEGGGSHQANFDFLLEANRLCTQARTFLQWSYVQAFSMPPHSGVLALFSDQQSYLEGTVERLQEKVQVEALRSLLKESGMFGGGGGAVGVKKTCTIGAATTPDPKTAASASAPPPEQLLRVKLERLRMDVITQCSAVSSFMKQIAESVREGTTLTGR